IDGAFDLGLAGATGNEVDGAIGPSVNNLTVSAGSLTAGSIDIDGKLQAGSRDGDGKVLVASSVSTGTLAAAAVDVTGNLTTTGAATSKAGVKVSGDATLGGAVTAKGGDVVLGDAAADKVTLTANSTLTASGKVDVAGSIDGAFDLGLAGATGNEVDGAIGPSVNNLTVSAGSLTAGSIDITGNLTSASAVTTTVGAINVDGKVDAESTLTAKTGVKVGGTSELGGNVTADGGSVVLGDTLEDSVTLTSNVTLEASEQVSIAGNVSSEKAVGETGYDLTLSAADVIDDGKVVKAGSTIEGSVSPEPAAPLVKVNNLTVSAGSLTAGSIDITGNLTSAAAVATTVEAINVGGNVDAESTLTAKTGVKVGGTSELGGAVTATAGDVALTGAVTLTGDVTLTATAGAVTAGGDIDGDFNLGLAGVNGNAVTGAIGPTVNAVTVTAGDLTVGSMDIDGNLAAAANVTTGGALTAAAVDVTGDLTAGGAVTAEGGVINVGGNVDAESTLTAKTGVKVGGTSEFGGAVTATAGDVDLTGAVTLTNDVTVAGKNVTFGSTVDSAAGTLHSLTVNSSNDGVTTFNGAIGATDRLSALTTNADGTVRINTGIVNVNGNSATFNDAVILGADLTIDESGDGAVTFNSTVDSAPDSHHTLTVKTKAGEIVFEKAVGATTKLGDVTLTSQGMTTIKDKMDVAGTLTVNTKLAEIQEFGVVDADEVKITADSVEIEGFVFANKVEIATESAKIQEFGVVDADEVKITANSAEIEGLVAATNKVHITADSAEIEGLVGANKVEMTTESVKIQEFGVVDADEVKIETKSAEIQGAVTAGNKVEITANDGGNVKGTGSIEANELRLTLNGGTFTSDGEGAFNIKGTEKVYVGAKDHSRLPPAANGLWVVTDGDASTIFEPNGVILGLVIHKGTLRLAQDEVMNEFTRENAFLALVREMKSRNGVFDAAYFIHSYMSLRDVVALGLIDFLNYGVARINYNTDEWPPGVDIDEQVGVASDQFRAR
ncbi:MAG: beta strand repeat-containing protein, partial [Lentisphaeria bacterium]